MDWDLAVESRPALDGSAIVDLGGVLVLAHFNSRVPVAGTTDAASSGPAPGSQRSPTCPT